MEGSVKSFLLSRGIPSGRRVTHTLWRWFRNKSCSSQHPSRAWLSRRPFWRRCRASLSLDWSVPSRTARSALWWWTTLRVETCTRTCTTNNCQIRLRNISPWCKRLQDLFWHASVELSRLCTLETSSIGTWNLKIFWYFLTDMSNWLTLVWRLTNRKMITSLIWLALGFTWLPKSSKTRVTPF